MQRGQARGGRRSIHGVPEQSQGGGGSVARQAHRRRRPPRGRRGFRLADHDGPGVVPSQSDCGLRLHGLGQANPPLDQPDLVAGDPGPRSADVEPTPTTGKKATRTPKAAATEPAPTASARSLILAPRSHSSSARPATAAAKSLRSSRPELTRHAAFLGARAAGRRRSPWA